MPRIEKKFRCAIAILGLILFSLPDTGMSAKASTTPEKLQEKYASEAKKIEKGFKSFSSEAGKTLYNGEHKTKKGETMSCATCHTLNPTNIGKTRAKKDIEPIAISANPKRFTDEKKVEKWFNRNCNDVLERECTALEKGNFIEYMKTAK